MPLDGTEEQRGRFDRAGDMHCSGRGHAGEGGSEPAVLGEARGGSKQKSVAMLVPIGGRAAGRGIRGAAFKDGGGTWG